MRREYYFVAAWTWGVAGLWVLAWIFSVGMSEINSYRVFGAIATWATLVFGCMYLCGKGIRRE